MIYFKYLFVILLCTLLCFTGCNDNTGENAQVLVQCESLQTTIDTFDAISENTKSISAEATLSSTNTEKTTEATTADFCKTDIKEARVLNEKEIIADLEVPSTSAFTQTTQEERPKEPSPAVVREPAHPGTDSHNSNGVTIDISNSSQGYICVKCDGSDKRLKLQILTDSMKYNYDINKDGIYETFPLQMGNGTYKARVMENVTGSSYIELYSYEFSVNLESSLLPFLYPNQYVNFSSSSDVVKKSEEICAGCENDHEKLKAIYNYMITQISYDYDKASSVKSGYLPDVDKILKAKKGICFDYSSLMAAMLRAQNIPAKLVVGSAGAYAQNHAWNEVYLSKTGWITLKIQNTATGWKLLDPTFGDKTGSESSYAAARFY